MTKRDHHEVAVDVVTEDSTVQCHHEFIDCSEWKDNMANALECLATHLRGVCTNLSIRDNKRKQAPKEVALDVERGCHSYLQASTPQNRYAAVRFLREALEKYEEYVNKQGLAI